MSQHFMWTYNYIPTELHVIKNTRDSILKLDTVPRYLIFLRMSNFVI